MGSVSNQQLLTILKSVESIQSTELAKINSIDSKLDDVTLTVARHDEKIKAITLRLDSDRSRSNIYWTRIISLISIAVSIFAIVVSILISFKSESSPNNVYNEASSIKSQRQTKRNSPTTSSR